MNIVSLNLMVERIEEFTTSRVHYQREDIMYK